MKIPNAELRSLIDSMPMSVDADDARELDAGFDKFVEKASARAAIASLYVTKAAHFSTLVPAELQGGDAWVLWLPYLDPIEIEELARDSSPPTVLRSPTKERDVRLAWCTEHLCFMAYESSFIASLVEAYKRGYVTVIVANEVRAAVHVFQVDDDFVYDLLLEGETLHRDPDNLNTDSDGRLLIELKPEPYRPKGIA